MKAPIYCFLAIAVLFLSFEFSEAAYQARPAIVCPSFVRALARGVSGEDVSDLQAFLASDPEIYPEGLATGYFGRLTEKALQRFQVLHGIVSAGSPENTGYGILGPKTRAKIMELCQIPAKLGEVESAPPLPVALSQGVEFTPQPSREGFFAPTLPHVKTTDVQSAEAPKMDLKINDSDGPLKVPAGSSVVLSWALSNHKWWYCAKLKDWSGSIFSPVSGSETISGITYTKFFKLICYVDNIPYEDEVYVEIGKAVSTAAPALLPAATTTALDAASTGLYSGSFGRLTCLARVRPSVAYIDQPPVEALWEVESSPIERHIYWREKVDGIDSGYIYWGKTNRSLVEGLPPRPAKITRYALVVADSRHAPDVTNPSPPEDVCITNTVEVEIKASKSSFNFLLKPFASILNAIFPGLIEY